MRKVRLTTTPNKSSLREHALGAEVDRVEDLSEADEIRRLFGGRSTWQLMDPH